MTSLEVLSALKKVVGYVYAYQFWLKYHEIDEETQRKVVAELEKDLQEIGAKDVATSLVVGVTFSG